MSSIYDRYQQINRGAQSKISFLNAPVFAALLQIFFVLFASQFAGALPNEVHRFIDNPWVQGGVLAIASWTSSGNPAFSVSLILAYIFLTRRINAKFVEGFPSSNRSAILTSCVNTTVGDLLDTFKTQSELLEAMNLSEVPHNTVIDNDNAPLIATYLVSHGYKLKHPCGHVF